MINCLDARRALLADPRRLKKEYESHLAACEACRSFAMRTAELDERVADAASIPAPEGLADRVLFARKRSRTWPYAAVAAAVVISAAVATVGPGMLDALPLDTDVDAVGPGHPAVAAISEVVEDSTYTPVPELEATDRLQRSFKRLGLAVPTTEATTHYVGKCHNTAGECEHIVLSTADAHANVILMPGARVDETMLVSDGQLVALVSPTASGAYVVVADKPTTARRIKRVLAKG